VRRGTAGAGRGVGRNVAAFCGGEQFKQLESCLGRVKVLPRPRTSLSDSERRTRQFFGRFEVRQLTLNCARSWQADVGAEVYLADSPAVEKVGSTRRRLPPARQGYLTASFLGRQAAAIVGIILTLATVAAVSLLQSFYNRHFKQS
jgi:hypothetical protein